MVDLLVCEHKGCINDLSSWEQEDLGDGALEIQCPECGALHELYKSSNDVWYIKLLPDNG